MASWFRLDKPLPFGLKWRDICTGVLSLTLLVQMFFLFMGFEIDRKINLLDVVNASLTLFLALYIPSQLAKQLQSRRYEGELLIARLHQLDGIAMTIRQFVQEGTEPGRLAGLKTRQVVTVFTSLAQSLELMQHLISNCSLPTAHRLLLLRELEQLITIRSDLLELTTGDSFTPGKHHSFARSRAGAISAKIQQMQLQCQRLILSVNRAA